LRAGKLVLMKFWNVLKITADLLTAETFGVFYSENCQRKHSIEVIFWPSKFAARNEAEGSFP
jgi:hypothetical protein